MLDRIQVDACVCEGRPTIRGLRITVAFVLKLFGDGYTAADIVREYPELEAEDVYRAARYGAWLVTERTSPIGDEATRGGTVQRQSCVDRTNVRFGTRG